MSADRGGAGKLAACLKTGTQKGRVWLTKPCNCQITEQRGCEVNGYDLERRGYSSELLAIHLLRGQNCWLGAG